MVVGRTANILHHMPRNDIVIIKAPILEPGHNVSGRKGNWQVQHAVHSQKPYAPSCLHNRKTSEGTVLIKAP